jgi:hypothetical protein
MPPAHQTPHRRRDTWWKVLCLDPVAARLDRPLANHPRVKGAIARATLGLGLAAAPCYALPGRWGPVAGAAGYLLGTLAERLLERRSAGRSARLRMVARGRDLCCALAFSLGQYFAHRQAVILLLGFEVLLLEAFRQVEDVQVPPIGEIETRFAWWDWAYWYDRLGVFLARHGVDERVFGGAEFRTTVFVGVPFVAMRSPVAAAWTAGLAGLLLVLSELSVGCRIWSLVRYYRDFPSGTEPEPYLLDLATLIPAARAENDALGTAAEEIAGPSDASETSETSETSEVSEAAGTSEASEVSGASGTEDEAPVAVEAGAR